MANEVIRLGSGIKNYEILNENDERVAVLRINVKDTHLMEKFVALFESADKIAKKMNASIEKFNKLESKTVEDNKKIAKESTNAINQLVKDTEAVFGAGLFREIFAECYELDAEFVPDIDSIIEFYEQVTPIMKTIFEQKNNKYGVAKKGKKKA